MTHGLRPQFGAHRRRHPLHRGFSLIEVMLTLVLGVLVAMAGVAHVTRGSQQAEFTRDRVFATQKALSILAELRGYVEGGQGETAVDLDRFDDGASTNPTLTIQTVPEDPNVFVSPDHPVSGNRMESGTWRWQRRITIRPYMDNAARDRRYCTVRVYRVRAGEEAPGTLLGEASGVVLSPSESYPSTQVYDVYIVSLENHPGWWVPPDGMRPFMEAALTELEAKSPGLRFRAHWITEAGYGRDEEYAPYSNETRLSTEDTPWAYVYPGRLRPADLPEGSPLESQDERYYDPQQMRARINLDGTPSPTFEGDYTAPEPFTDDIANGRYDAGEPFTDLNGNGVWDAGNTLPYALADVHNHCMRWPEANERFQARVAAGLESQDEPTLRLLLDDMVAHPGLYKNAIVVNMHGEVLPCPPVRNYSDPASDPLSHPGWRVVTHPERLRPARNADATLAQAPRFRVYAWRNQFDYDPAHKDDASWDGGGADTMTQEEPYLDLDRNGYWSTGEPYQDWNGNGRRDEAAPITIVLDDGDFTGSPNASVSPSIVVRCLAGGVDADGNGTREEYEDWKNAPRYPETFTDLNGNGIFERAEPFYDVDEDGVRSPWEPWQELDGNGVYTPASEPLDDQNGNGYVDLDRPEEPFTDGNGNGKWDAAEPYWDVDGDGRWTPPTAPKFPWKPYQKSWVKNAGKTTQYIEEYGEPFLDMDGSGSYTPAEAFYDTNQNGVWDGGYKRGEMWWRIAWWGAYNRTILTLYNTPLKAPESPSGAGLNPEYRLYGLDYVPCPTPALAAGADRFERDLFEKGKYPKNTARWTIELPPASLARALESAPGAGDGNTRDHMLTVETRIGDDVMSGRMWPTPINPPNRSATYAWYYASTSGVPYSERYQFIGDPRHSPYADTDATGTSFPRGYNWFFVKDFDQEGKKSWLAFDTTRMTKLWRDRCAHDVPRFTAWWRHAVVDAESVYGSMTGYSVSYLSLGGDVGYDKSNPLKAIPMSGLPFGISSEVDENSLVDEGTGEIKGSSKFLRSNDGFDKGIRAGGYWWSKPWIGELYPDAAYVGQWAPWGNLRAGLQDAAAPLTYRLVKWDQITTNQLPKGTKLQKSRGALLDQGCVSFFMIGVKDSTFHHRRDAKSAVVLVDQGFQLGSQYGYIVPTTAKAPHLFALARKGEDKVDPQEPPEFFYPDDYPHFTGTLGGRFYAKDPNKDDKLGSALVRLADPADAHAGRVVVTGLDPDTMNGPVFHSRYTVLTLLHGLLSEGLPGTPHRIPQLPRVAIHYPTSASRLEKPTQMNVSWYVWWKRWDDQKYTADYPDTFAESTADIVYVLMYSADNGKTWRNMRTDAPAEPGVLPTKNGTVDLGQVLLDANPGSMETFAWDTPRAKIPDGSYFVRVEAYRPAVGSHYAYHMEKIYVDR